MRHHRRTCLLTALLVLLPLAVSWGGVLSGRRGTPVVLTDTDTLNVKNLQKDGKNVEFRDQGPFANRPTNPAIMDTYIIEDSISDTDCNDGGAGEFVLRCWWTGTTWALAESTGAAIVVPSTATLDDVLTRSLATDTGLTLTPQTPLPLLAALPTGTIRCTVYIDAAIGLIYDSCGTKQTYEGTNKRLKPIWLPATSLKPDGTQCVASADVTIASEPGIDTIVCTDNAASIIRTPWLRMPKSWDCGVLSASITVADVASSAQVFGVNFAGQVRSTTAISTTYGTDSADSIATMTTANIPYSTSPQAFTANGTCGGIGSDLLRVKATVDSAGVHTDANANVLGMTLWYLINSDSDN